MTPEEIKDRQEQWEKQIANCRKENGTIQFAMFVIFALIWAAFKFL